MTGSVVSVVYGGVPQGVITWLQFISPVNEGSSLIGLGSVTPGANAANVLWVLDTQNVNLPASGYATVSLFSDPEFEVVTSKTLAAGNYYMWAKDPGTGAFAVSQQLTINSVPHTLAITSPTALIQTVIQDGQFNHFFADGTVSPVSHPCEYALSASNTVAPTTGWTALTNDGFGNLSATVTPTIVGTYYLWFQDTVSGLTAVSTYTIIVWNAITNITYPSGSQVHETEAVCSCTIPPTFYGEVPFIEFKTTNTGTAPASVGTGFTVQSTNGDGSRIMASGPTNQYPTSPGSYYTWLGIGFVPNGTYISPNTVTVT